MNISEFKRVLTTFADEPADVDIRAGRVVAQVRDDVVEAEIKYSASEDRHLRVLENGQEYSARTWIINRVARIPQLADRVLSVAGANSGGAQFVTPSGRLSADLASEDNKDTEVSDVVAVVGQMASAPIPGATSVLYLTSDAGEGKTTVLNRAAMLQARQYKERTASSLIVPIPLGGRSFLTFDDAVIAALVNKLRFNYLYFDSFIELVRMGVIVPAFDGYEEMLVEGSKGEAVSALGNLVQRLDSSGTVLIAARKAFFEYLSFRTQARLLDAIGDRSVAFSRLALSRWSRKQFCDYGSLRGVSDAGAIYETVASRLSETHPLLTRAVLVRRLFDVLDGVDRGELLGLLGRNPQDYFYTFVDAIIKREATEKWLLKVSGDVGEPLLTSSEHHLLLSSIAVEMWLSSSNSLRFDVIDLVVDIFCDAGKKNGMVTRQIKERIKQHSLLSSETSRGQGLGFDHEDFYNFFLGEGLGSILARKSAVETQNFLAMALISQVTVEQAVQNLIRNRVDIASVIECLVGVNKSESGYSICKENCGALVIRLMECMGDSAEGFVLTRFYFPVGVLSGKSMRNVRFSDCHFQPTGLSGIFDGVEFECCEFERIEVDSSVKIHGMRLDESCVVDSLVVQPGDEHVYDPSVINSILSKLGLGKEEQQSIAFSPGDERMKVVERFLRIFLRSTQADEEIIKLRLGKVFAPIFFDSLLPLLIGSAVLEEVPWRGQGVQRRFKLMRPMAEIGDAFERSGGDFDRFLKLVGK
jgi:hypothetical protein